MCNCNRNNISQVIERPLYTSVFIPLRRIGFFGIYREVDLIHELRGKLGNFRISWSIKRIYGLFATNGGVYDA